MKRKLMAFIITICMIMSLFPTNVSKAAGNGVTWDNNKDLTLTLNTYDGAKATTSVNTGKRYFEVYLADTGISHISIESKGYGTIYTTPYSSSFSYRTDGLYQFYNQNSNAGFIGSTQGDYIGIGIDTVTGEITLFKNGIALISGFIPVSDAYTALISGPMGLGGSATTTTNFGATPFQYLPDGFMPYDTSTLAVLLETGEVLQLANSFNLADNINFSWSSTDSSVADVDPNTGVVTAIKEGMATILISNSQGYYDTVLIKVLDNVTDDMRTTVYLKIGESKRIYLNDDYSNITWTSFDPNMLSVDQTGKITGIAHGMVLVTAEYKGEIHHIYIRVE